MSRYHSERDFLANYIFLKLKEASRVIGVSDIIDFHVETIRIRGKIQEEDW